MFNPIWRSTVSKGSSQTTSSLSQLLKQRRNEGTNEVHARRKFAFTSRDVLFANRTSHELACKLTGSLGSQRDNHEARCQTIQPVDS